MIKRLLGLNLNFWAGFPIVEGGGGGGARKAWRSPHPVFERDNVVFPIETFKILCKKSDTVPYKILLN